MKKIAPTLQTFFGGERNPFRHPVVDDALRAELRALLAVAMAANRSPISPIDHPELCRALARLDKVSGRKGGGR